ncbi:MAG TPA: hypothetical protein VIY48_08040 [Candidatus Paceibacterota bacterium]
MEQKQKLSGMELMLHNLMRAAGIDPQEIARNVETTVKQFQAGMQHMENRLAQIDARLERIERALAISDEVEENKEPERRVISG